MSRQSQHWRLINKRKWAKVRLQVLASAGHRCAECSRAGRLEIDHRIPLHVDASDPYDLSNLQAMCRSCHIAKTSLENSRPNPARDRWRQFISDRIQATS